MTITVASGTSTPTSTTVVATRSEVTPALKSSMARSFSSVPSLPWMRPTPWSDSSSDSWPYRSVAAARSESLSSMSGQIQYALSPASKRFLKKLITVDRRLGGTTLVTTPFRPGGMSGILETERSPYTVRVNVLGMGVAVMTRTWGDSPLVRKVCF